MTWLCLLAALLATQIAHGIMNSTSIITLDDGMQVYPCLQLNHRVPTLERYMLGVWYAIEIIQHRDDPSSRGLQITDSCPRLNVINELNNKGIVQLIWYEKAGDIHYTFKMTDPDNGGWWMVWKKQDGSMVNKLGFEQFAGTVQVMEAQDTKMVLTFCATNQVHFSVVMIRNISYVPDTRDVHQKLSTYGLQEFGVRQTCRNQTSPDSAIQSLPNLLIVLTTALLLTFRPN
uniref:Lipocalin/cytosolic fatty-acid binding domain-containing protein n=2 Tax=Cuerna arida TaxID=1464854 RepID=A0A1B6G7P8_9HEMI